MKTYQTNYGEYGLLMNDVGEVANSNLQDCCSQIFQKYCKLKKPILGFFFITSDVDYLGDFFFHLILL